MEERRTPSSSLERIASIGKDERGDDTERLAVKTYGQDIEHQPRRQTIYAGYS
jgi:hypothetical protein